MKKFTSSAGLSLILLFLLISSKNANADLNEHQLLALDIFKELIETNTTNSSGDTGVAADKMAKKLLDAGFPPGDVIVIKNAPGKGNLVARLRSPNPVKGPILLLAHIDVVEANPEDWTVEPFVFLDKGKHYYGRGTIDDKDEASIHIANLIQLKQQGYLPNRDIIVALTADEEGGPDNGVQFLLANHRELVNADLVINEGGGGLIQNGKHVSNAIQAAEKVYQSYTLEVTNAGGHSSRPNDINAIYQLAHALINIEAYTFPISLNETTRAQFKAGKATQSPQIANRIPGLLESTPSKSSVAFFAKIPAYNALLRTTCVATQLKGGHAENALPQRASATVNCRILPGVPPESIQKKLIQLIANSSVSVTPVKAATPSDPSPLTEEIMSAVTDISLDMWPGVAIVPSMSTGATDGLYFRNAGIPVYGVSGSFREAGESRAHGRDERILKQSYFDSLEFLDRLTRKLSAP